MLGYWGQIPPKTSDTCDEGWFDTGDIGEIDEYGNLWLIGRLKNQDWRGKCLPRRGKNKTFVAIGALFLFFDSSVSLPSPIGYERD